MCIARSRRNKVECWYVEANSRDYALDRLRGYSAPTQFAAEDEAFDLMTPEGVVHVLYGTWVVKFTNPYKGYSVCRNYSDVEFHFLFELPSEECAPLPPNSEFL